MIAQRPLNFALVGCGRVSRKYVEALGASEVARIAAVCDVQPDRARDLAQKLDVPWFTDMDRMLASVAEIDVASILTPSGRHADHALRVAAHQKHVIVEKPIALSVHDTDAMIAACAHAGVKLLVAKPVRYNAPVQRLRAAVETGRFGKFVMGTIRVRWCRRQDYYDRDGWRGKSGLDGGVLANQASHYLDLLLWMMGPVRSVSAMSATRLVDIETEDTAAAVLRFASGALGVVEATTAARPIDLEGSISILGERGSVVVGGPAANELVTWKFEDALPEDPVTTPRSGYPAFIADAVRHIHGDEAPVVDGVEARKSIELLAAIQESARSGQEIVLPG